MTGLLRRKRFNARGRRGRLLASLMTLSVLATAGLAAPAGSLARTSGAKPLIEGGETPAEGTYGYVGRVIGNAPEGEFLCSSSLIAPQWVLTAGHCVGPANGGAVYAASDFKVTLGAVNWKKGTAYGVSEVFRNPGYLLNWKPEDLVRDDSGLLRLSTPSSVTPIALISAARFASEIKDGTIVSAAGWGLTTPNAEEFTETLKVVHGLKVLEENEAESEGNKVLIGTEAAKGTCPGDSGGPFIDSRGEEIASTSAGPSNECNHTQAQSIPAVYGWIRETIGPDVTSSPASTDAAVGDSVTFTVACTGKPAPTVQWQLSTNGGTSFAEIEGATGPSYVTPAATLAMSGYQYRAVCSGSLGEEASAAATLTVFPVPTVTALSVKKGTTAGGTIVTVTGTGFTGATTVKFGTVEAKSFEVSPSGTTLTAVSPEQAAGTVAIYVTTPGGTNTAGKKDKFKVKTAKK